MTVVVDDKEYESMDSIVMADDGMGSSVSIPTFLVDKKSGQILKDAVHKQDEARAQDAAANAAGA